MPIRCFFFSSRRRHTRCSRDWSSDVCSSDLIQRARDVSVLEGVYFELNQAAANGVLRLQAHLALDPIEQSLLEKSRRGQDLAVLAPGPVTGSQEIEQLREVAADRVVGGEQAEIGVEARGTGMIVAGADMSVAAQAVVVLPHDLDDLAVSLEPDHAVHNVDSELLEPGCEVNIGFLVEPRLELDHDGHLLSVARRVAQVADDASVRRGAVKC